MQCLGISWSMNCRLFEDFPAEFEAAWPGSLQCNYDCMAQYTPGSAFGQMYVSNIGPGAQLDSPVILTSECRCLMDGCK